MNIIKFCSKYKGIPKVRRYSLLFSVFAFLLTGCTSNNTIDKPEPGKDNLHISIEDRITHLEERVQSLQSDMQKVMPGISRLSAIEPDIKNVIAAIYDASDESKKVLEPVLNKNVVNENIADKENAVFQDTPQAKPSEKEPSVITFDVPLKSLNTVSRVRIGQAPGKERFVVDFERGSHIVFAKENNGRNLIITMSDVNWLAQKSWHALSPDAVIKSYEVSASRSKAVLTLTIEGRVTDIFELPAEGLTEGPKIVIDAVK